MRRFISISVLLTLVLGNTEFHQLVKLPTLFAHYFEHKSENNSLTFFSFLKEHYQNDTNRQNHDHRNLPFKSHECSHFAQLMIAEPQQEHIGFRPDFFAAVQAGQHEDLLPQEVQASIWQPPQFL